MRPTLPGFALALALGVAGCGPQVTAPPLDVRPMERETVELPAPEREPDLPAAPALAGALAAQVAAAEAGHDRFAAARAVTEQAALRGAKASPGSEPWTAAQQALTALLAARAPVAGAAQAVEVLRLDPANAGPAARAAVAAAAARIDALDEAEAAAVAAIAARLAKADPTAGPAAPVDSAARLP